MNRKEYLYPYSRYRGEIKPETLVFNANLQEFAQKVNFIANLETSGKLPPAEAYDQISFLWQQLQLSQQNLKIGRSREQ